MSFDHLVPAAQNAVLLSKDDRIEFIQSDCWIGYSAANTILDELDDLINHPRNLRMPCRAIVGDPDNGKSSLLRRCAKRNPNREAPDGLSHVAVGIFETPSAPSERRLYSAILKALRVAHREDAPADKLMAKVVDRCTEFGIRLLMADEFHNMLNGSAADQRQFLASLKSLLNMLGVAFAVAGTRDIVTALATDKQFITRFERLALPRWGKSDETRRLLMSLEKVLPLAKPSNIANVADIGTAIMLGGGGTIGGIVRVVKRSAIAAIDDGQEQITKDIVDAVVADIRSREVVA